MEKLIILELQSRVNPRPSVIKRLEKYPDEIQGKKMVISDLEGLKIHPPRNVWPQNHV